MESENQEKLISDSAHLKLSGGFNKKNPRNDPFRQINANQEYAENAGADFIPLPRSFLFFSKLPFLSTCLRTLLICLPDFTWFAIRLSIYVCFMCSFYPSP